MGFDFVRLKTVASDLFVRTLTLPGVRPLIGRKTVDAAELRAIAGDADRSWTYAPERTVVFERPDRLDGRFRAIETKVGAHCLDEAFVAELRDVELVGPDAIPILDDGRWLLENAGQSENLLVRSVLSSVASGTVPTRQDDVGTGSEFDTLVSLVGPWSREYFHWMSEWLPRLEGVEHYADRTGRSPTVLVPGDPPDWLTDSLQVVGFDSSGWTEWTGGRATVDRLVVPSLRRAHPVDDPRGGYTNSPEGFRWIRRRALERIDDGSRSSFAPRIYVSRAGADERRVLNEDAVVDALRAFGFESYRLEELSFSDQATMFADAEVVVGPHGAGLVNAIFGTDLTVVELFGRYVNACYYTMCEGLGFGYEPVACEPAGPHLRVDVDELTARVGRAID